LVLNVTLNQDVLIEKLLGRRVCEKCGENYNICEIKRDGYDFDPLNPKKQGICDKDGGKLIIRADDNQEVISARMKEYDEKTKPLLDVFKSRGRLYNFEAKKGVKDYPDLKKHVQKHLKI